MSEKYSFGSVASRLVKKLFSTALHIVALAILGILKLLHSFLGKVIEYGDKRVLK